MPIGVGETAPDFALSDQHGVDVRLSGFRDIRNVVLVFYPFAFTGICTGELRALRDHLPLLEGADTAVLGVSCDTMFALRVFADREGLTYPLLADFWPHGAVAQAYGVFDEERGCALRGTFVIDRAGVVRWRVVNAIPDAREVTTLVRAVEELPR
ncbi:peroxiredoxin [Actinopolymorpha sp. B11F2]|uniref:peroxiredoxin n=1 Tax=Actinopolymorpha sp. B11F2 TaxID=3160862 RepID=UPI0032E4C8AD